MLFEKGSTIASSDKRNFTYFKFRPLGFYANVPTCPPANYFPGEGMEKL